MKKLLGVLILGLLWCNISFANDNRVEDFNQWLTKNGHYDYVNNAEVPEICKQEKRYSNVWYYNKCDQIKSGNTLDIKFYKSSEIPWEAKPNKDTLLHHGLSTLLDHISIPLFH